MPVEQTATVQRTRTYPHTENLGDSFARQVARILFDQIYTLQERVTAAEATITSLLAAVNALQGETATVRRDTDQALGPTQT